MEKHHKWELKASRHSSKDLFWWYVSQLLHQPWCRVHVVQRCLYPVSARSVRGCCVRWWLTSSGKQCVCGICSKRILKQFSDIPLPDPPHFILWFIEIVFPSRKAGKIQHTVKFLRYFLLLFLSTQTTFWTWTGDWLAEYKDWWCVSWTSRTW